MSNNESKLKSNKPLFTKTLQRLNKPTLSLTSAKGPISLPTSSIQKKKPQNLTLNLNTSTADENEKERNNTGTATIDLQSLDIFSNNKNNIKKANTNSLPGTPTTVLSYVSNGGDSSNMGCENVGTDENIALEDLAQLGKIGAGNSGTVMKVLHVPSQVVYAKKIIPLPSTLVRDEKGIGAGIAAISDSQNRQIKLQIKRELEIMDKIGRQDENSNIVTFKNAFYNTIEIEELVTPLTNTDEVNTQMENLKIQEQQEIEIFNKNASTANEIIIIMEYMNLGSLDKILQVYKEHCKRTGQKINPKTSWFNRNFVISRVAHDVLNGLDFLYENFKIIHRDIKPSNILLNSKGLVKICDFGVSKNTVNSIVDTFVGTSTYMSPERIQGGIYTTKGDVWSLGLSIIELLTGKFPLDNRDVSYKTEMSNLNNSLMNIEGDNSLRPDGILDLLQRIVNEPPPHLPTNYPFDANLVDFVSKCCIKDPDERASIKELLKHKYIIKYNFNENVRKQETYVKDFKKYCKELKKLIHDEKLIKRQRQMGASKR
ncbi:uncharacterized protein HGUI_02070 [Hanseniaspora guilliermondii]|uniref:mitogen-activated protein kinase kinase n=1 Tax=Hanseniaspora guilliermondii TaxID=56406 RepID=A0A1L0FJV4_9ASCO|nr:uncharacterized protein HGUI_02070 [Hanseniaspora guilliermondii]